ncbi:MULTISPECIES: hypothetical protein [unclassified Knoellia]|uniref:hypothetical protein n=1 Tax=Knoellia altitudinis TaxID=3404795 RepID=UPI0036237FCD
MLTLWWSFTSSGEGGTVPNTQVLVYMGVVLVPLGVTLGGLAAAALPSRARVAPLPHRLLTLAGAALALLALWQLFSHITGLPSLL